MWCAPVPNAWPGSITRSIAVAVRAAAPTAAARAAGGSATLTSTGRWNAFQRSDQSSGTSELETSTSASPAAARRSGSAGQLARRAVDHVLDRAVAELALLQPAGRELEQLGEHRLGVGARDADREPDHAALQHARPPTRPARAARPRAGRGARTPRRPRPRARPARRRRSSAPAGARARRRRSPASRSSVRFAVTVGAHGAGVAARLSQCVRTLTPLAAALRAIASSPSGITSTAVDRAEAQPRGGDREDAAARAPVAQRAAGVELEQQLQAQLRRRMRARAEQRARVDHDLERVGVAGGRLPRRPDPQPAPRGRDLDRLQVLVPAPLPAGRRRRSASRRSARRRRARGRRRARAAPRAARRPRTRPRPGRARSPPRRCAGSAAAPRARSPPARAGPGSRAARAARGVIPPARA